MLINSTKIAEERVVVLGCGLANRLYTISAAMDRFSNVRFYWHPQGAGLSLIHI